MSLRLLGGKFLALTFALIATGYQSATAQEQRSYPEHGFGFRCAFDSVQDAAWRRNPAGRAQYQAFLRQVRELPAADLARLAAAPDVTVPIVMHIIHTGGSNNISDAQVQDALRVINLDYSKTNRDTADVIPAFRSRYANVGYRFRLARRDPNGNCTTGITRTYSTDTNIGDDRVKSLIVWDQNRYLNVWICTAANGAGGYAYLPCQGGAGDGIVIRNAQFGSIGTSGGGNLAIRSLTHEIGHYFGLPHTWGGSNTPGLPSNCNIDDGIADTPNTIGSGGSCNAPYGNGTVLYNFNPCGPLANVQNYMDYSGCTRMFTTGQKAVMRGALALTCRSSLATAANLVATGTNDGYAGGACAPIVAFRSSTATLCEGDLVSFIDDSYNADLTAAGVVYNWQFAGGMPATSNQRAPVVQYNAAGIYAVTLTITTAGGSGSLTRTGLVQVSGPGTGLRAPLAESFENPDFPLNFAAPDLRNWASTSTSTASAARWQRAVPNASGVPVVADGGACLRMRSSMLSASAVITYLTSPNIDLSAFSTANPPVLRFSRAYARKVGVNAENLQVQASTDCGVSWQTEATYSVAALNTAGTSLQNGFVPDSLQFWQTLSLPIDPIYLSSPRFQLRFALTSRQGNDFYLDAVRLGLPTPVRAAAFARAGLQLAPNPYTAETTVALTLARPTRAAVQLTDALGRVLGTGPVQVLSAGAHHLALPLTSLPPGLYVVRVLLDEQPYTAKLVVN